MENIEKLKLELAEAKKKQEKVWEEYMDMADRDIPFQEAWSWYENQPIVQRCAELDRQIRNLEEPELKDLDDPDWCDHMTMKEFVKCCNIGPLFTDDDGFGVYATKDKQTDIHVYPSDILSGNYRKDFTHVVWYNK